MKKKPLVSIIIPTFNRAVYLIDALESIKCQSYLNWECVVVDDGSTDNTQDIVLNYCKNDDRFIYSKRPNNFKKGANGSRNYGLSLSKGEYLGFCDDDDYWLQDKLEKQLAVFEKYPQYGLVTGNIEFVNEDGIRTERVIQQLHKNGYVFEEFLLKNKMSMITPLMKSEVFDKVGDFNTDFNIYEDWEFWRRAAYYFEFYAIQEVLACVRRHKENTLKVLQEDPIEQFMQYYKLTRATLVWGEAHFDGEDLELIQRVEWLRYKQIMSNHYSGLFKKMKFLISLFKTNPLYLSRVIFLSIKY